MESSPATSATAVAAASIGSLNTSEYPPPSGSRTVDSFKRLRLIGEGTYGQVYEAIDEVTGERTAIKKIKLDDGKEGFPRQILREIKLLKRMDHENIVKLKEVVLSDEKNYKGDIYMVFEYMDHDLSHILHHSLPSQMKYYMKQLLMGLQYCHSNNIFHRDIKGPNILINSNKELKIADFGLARQFVRDGNFTNRVITLWYRPPELLLGATNYSEAVDMWSVGCIFAQFLTKKPLFPGKTEQEQLQKIFELCGTPNEENWPGVSSLPFYSTLKSVTPTRRSLRDVFELFDNHAVDLLDRMLTLDPSQRISAKEALDSMYFVY